ncbi:uncharacterized protein BO95DRAFT_181896 [Aspergillus brunneoviolaceus CBS 621.78]|uniref:Uncharacterized protein n=1 Tax=Aspergillus brunneoviolaceus CBS 621.78 TaxID=1450534 RepID=A0ACD1G519_9EURO|nr:hypothetical protein BO95DRAFT_181896 [Aspergillus brunneoviolaceus CBS 621.78]RAH44239.1 hypothetical protein BO95DRAFT_181896 [Aspergillus brunneoviolaceus CBS 621.78]
MQIVIHRSINLAFSISLHAVWSINPERACACELAIPRSYLLRDNCQNLWPVATTQSPNPETFLSDDLLIDKAAPATPPLITDRVQNPYISADSKSRQNRQSNPQLQRSCPWPTSTTISQFMAHR